MKYLKLERNTKETQIQMELNMATSSNPEISTGLPFFDHMLTAMAFHGGFSLKVKAKGDLEVDPHHLVEDTGIVLGKLLHESFVENSPLMRYGNYKIPMDDALAEVTVDICNRAYLVHNIDYPQNKSGDFDMFLLKEFFQALANNAQINLHCQVHYGDNSHHMSEALFKALGKALEMAYTPLQKDSGQMSTKGVL